MHDAGGNVYNLLLKQTRNYMYYTVLRNTNSARRENTSYFNADEI
jgi:hypothetical protein